METPQTRDELLEPPDKNQEVHPDLPGLGKVQAERHTAPQGPVSGAEPIRGWEVTQDVRACVRACSLTVAAAAERRGQSRRPSWDRAPGGGGARGAERILGAGTEPGRAGLEQSPGTGREVPGPRVGGWNRTSSPRGCRDSGRSAAAITDFLWDKRTGLAARTVSARAGGLWGRGKMATSRRAATGYGEIRSVGLWKQQIREMRGREVAALRCSSKTYSKLRGAVEVMR